MTPPHLSGGETEEEKQYVDMLENHFMDLRMNFARLCYSPDFVSAPRARDCPHNVGQWPEPPPAQAHPLPGCSPGVMPLGSGGAGGSSPPDCALPAV